jgi:hypothetical protein
MALFHPNRLYHISHPFFRRDLLLQYSSHVSCKLRLISKNVNCVQCSQRRLLGELPTIDTIQLLSLVIKLSGMQGKLQGSCFPVHAKYVPLLSNDAFGSVQSTLTLWSLAFHRGGSCLLPTRSMWDLLGRKWHFETFHSKCFGFSFSALFHPWSTHKSYIPNAGGAI